MPVLWDNGEKTEKSQKKRPALLAIPKRWCIVCPVSDSSQSTISKGVITMKIDGATIITKVLQYSYNVDPDQFKADLEKVIGWSVSKEYANEKMRAMRKNFVRFFCNLDKDTKERFVKQCLLYYGIDEQ